MSGFAFHPEALTDLNEMWELLPTIPAQLTVFLKKSMKRFALSFPFHKWATVAPI
jgi:hypothetical protein